MLLTVLIALMLYWIALRGGNVPQWLEFFQILACSDVSVISTYS